MSTDRALSTAHPAGEQPEIEHGKARPVVADTFAGPVHVTWEHDESPVVGYNPHKPGRPSHTYHSYILANLRLVLDVEVQAGNQHAAKYSTAGLWALLDRLGLEYAPWLVRGDTDWGNERVMRAAEGRGQAYPFKLRLTRRVKRVLALRQAQERQARGRLAGGRGRLAPSTGSGASTGKSA